MSNGKSTYITIDYKIEESTYLKKPLSEGNKRPRCVSIQCNRGSGRGGGKTSPYLVQITMHNNYKRIGWYCKQCKSIFILNSLSIKHRIFVVNEEIIEHRRIE